MEMFCYQCEQTYNGEVCDKYGVCGKSPRVAALQDLLIYACKGISMYAHRARQYGVSDQEIDRFVIKALFTTVTNVNFDEQRIKDLVLKADKFKNRAKNMYVAAAKENKETPENVKGPALWTPNDNIDQLVEQGHNYTLENDVKKYGKDVGGVIHLILYGLKGMASYADHAMLLGKDDESVYAFFHKTLNTLAENSHDLNSLLGIALDVGKINIRVMELLDNGHTETFGHPEPTKVRVTPIKGKSILVSGHDLIDLKQLLIQTQGKGINVYTHGEMLPANAYPELKKYKHLVGNYGGAWQDQKKEFDEFPGAILMTTNCIQKPKETYKQRIFTTGLVAWPGVTHISNKDFTPVINAALEAEGFKQDESEHKILIGFARNAVLNVADKVVEAVKNGDIKHFFLIGGCDGAKTGRNYYTEFAEKVPQDCVMLTLACGKYRFNKIDFGQTGGIPRLLDVGQCNDAYSAIEIAKALANAFDTDINSLPLSLILSWYEQKAVVILLSLLYLGIEDMRLGPTMPAFIKKPVYDVLKEKFNLIPVTDADKDLETILS